VWAPLSELYGRNVAFYCSYPVFVVFNLVGALSPNIATVLASRLIAGTFGASPITNAGGQISDMFPA
jgi:MFS family permease